MFDVNSRYAKNPIVEVDKSNSKKVNVIKLRHLPYVGGNLSEVKGIDRLDIMAHRNYKDGTKFWHVADANTELEANDLVTNKLPENPLQKQETTFIFIPEN